MKPLSAWVVSVFAAVVLFVVARSKNLFVEHNAYTLYGLIVATFVLPMIIGLVWPDKVWRWAVPVIAGVLAGDLAAIRRDLIKDSTSHLNWPSELSLLAVVAAVCALAGAFTGGHISRKRRNPTG